MEYPSRSRPAHPDAVLPDGLQDLAKDREIAEPEIDTTILREWGPVPPLDGLGANHLCWLDGR